MNSLIESIKELEDKKKKDYYAARRLAKRPERIKKAAEKINTIKKIEERKNANQKAFFDRMARNGQIKKQIINNFKQEFLIKFAAREAERKAKRQQMIEQGTII